MKKVRSDTQNESLTELTFCVGEERSFCTEKNQVRLLADESFWFTIVALISWTSTMNSVSSSRVVLRVAGS
jgi:hypothetical protein